MKKTPLYTIVVLIGVGFFLGLLFADLTHDLQVGEDQESVKLAQGYYQVMIVKSKQQGPILLVAVGVVGLASLRQLFAIRSKSLLALFVLTLGALLYLFVDVLANEMLLTADKNVPPRPLLEKIRQTHLLMVGACGAFGLVMIMITRYNKPDAKEVHEHHAGCSHADTDKAKVAAPTSAKTKST